MLILNQFLLKMEKQIEIYRKEHAYHLKRRKDYFKSIPSSEIVSKAALSTNANGKMFPHQYRVGKAKTELAANKLLQFEAEILSAQSFEDIFKFTEEVRKLKIGLGHLWSYDTALHIGFKLGLLPNEVYMQAGVVNGYIKLFNKKPNGRKINKNQFPMLAQFEAYEIENFLCTWGSKSKIKLC